MVDFSIFKNIDFSNKDNLLFLSIFLVIMIIVLLIFVVIAVEIINIIKKAIIRMLAKKHKPEQQIGIAGLCPPQEVKEVNNAPKQGVVVGGFINNFNVGETKPEDASPKEIKIPAIQRKITSGGFIKNFIAGEKKSEEKQNNTAKSFEEKEKKGILEHLNKLKTDKDEGKETLASKMPPRQPAEKNNIYDKIEIPTSKRFDYNKKSEKEAVVISSKLHGQKLVYEKGKMQIAEKTPQGQDEKSIKSLLGEKKSNVKIPIAVKNPPNKQAEQDGSIFEGKEEISRIKLKYKLRFDPKIWQAQKDLRMNLTPIQRIKLEKETFAPRYGRNISKKDLRVNLKKMGREWVTTTDMKRKEVLRKEIKFFKKIGGIK